MWNKKMEEKNQKGINQDALQEFRNCIHAAAERPDAFWVKQRANIAEKFRQPSQIIRYPLAFRWASAALVVLLCLALFMQEKRLPKFDLAAGADQELLIEVERSLNRKYPDALAPAAILSKQIEPHTINGRE
jgi:hypothetical protein